MRKKLSALNRWILPALVFVLCACQSQSVEQTQADTETTPLAVQDSPQEPARPTDDKKETTVSQAEQQAKVAYVKMTIKDKGDLIIELDLKEAPKTSENFLNLVKEKFYDGIRFHRVVPDFVIQAGDPQSKTLPMGHPQLGTGGSGKNIKFEPNNLKHKRGAIGMARAQDPDSASSQFYICLKDLPPLDGNYVIFGRVVEGIEIIDKVRVGDTIEKAVVLEKWAPKKAAPPSN
ncbi:MAG: peptidyl-prolyl cis-trans isomerase [Fimbriimonadales bacterium]|nr:MAG: peptidyl-prolyl cis-trans isomerase [Fimbriimonadales bacterium]